MDTNDVHDGTDEGTLGQGGIGATAVQIVRQLTGFVATILGEDWSVDPFEGQQFRDAVAFLNGPDGARLKMAVTNVSQPSHVIIAGVYPRHHVPGVKHHQISVARDRGPAVIAREITRRLLPDYELALEHVRSGALQQLQQADAVRLLTQQLSALLDIPGRPSTYSLDRGRVELPGGPNGAHGHVQLDPSGEYGHIELFYATADLLRAIAEVIGTDHRQTRIKARSQRTHPAAGS